MKTILIIDDEAHVPLLYAQELQELGYLAIGTDGRENPLQLISRHKPDLVILGIKFKDTSGLDLLQSIRQEYPQLPVILNTAYDSFRFDLKSVAADAYILKSGDSTEELMSKVRELCPAHGGTRTESRE